MTFLSLTAATRTTSTMGDWPVIKQIAWVLGFIMQGIFVVLSGMGIHSIAACIIIFTIVTKMLMLPLTIKQQKFSKIQALMSPEIQALQKKYAGKRDQASMAKMQMEQQQIYDKYGSSMSAGCLPSLIQFPILFALYPVVLDLPRYVPQLANYSEAEVLAMYQFLGLDLSVSPSSNIFSAAILIPILAGLSQFVSSKLMMANQPSMEDNPMGSSMKMMNYMMPLMSVFICFSLPSFLGLYWVVQSVVMLLQQLAINKYMEKISVEDLIKQNIEKQNKKRAKKGLPPLSERANINTKKIAQPQSKEDRDKQIAERDAKIKSSTEYYNKKAADPNSLAARANMVRDFDERSNKKK